MELWGSDCRNCGNATPGSQTCDVCNSERATAPLWIVVRPVRNVAVVDQGEHDELMRACGASDGDRGPHGRG